MKNYVNRIWKIHYIKTRLQGRCLLLVLLCSVFTHELFAQVGTINAVPQPLSPNAAALGKFVEVPVGNYSGLPEINIPIYQFKAKDVNVPISLSYHASGVKVQEIPGWVGANWNLGAGGAIVRVVRGLPDGADGYWEYSFYKENAKVLGWPGGYDFPDPRKMPNIQSDEISDKIDTEYDLYYFNFMGHTGRFTFDNDGKPLMLDANDFKVLDLWTSFEITDTEGIVYVFEAYETSYSPNSPQYPSAWNLSKIIIPHQNETINFNYKNYQYNDYLYRYPVGPASFYERFLFQDIFPPSGTTTNPACPSSNGMANYPEFTQMISPVLRSITYKGDSVKFYHDTSRADVYKIRLDSIRVFQGANPVHATRFSYTFSNSGSSDFKDKKMLLTAVQSNDQPAYSLTYYNSFNSKTLPGPYELCSDLWGYFNGGSYTIYTPVTTPHHPDFRYGQIGSLQTITYPTGGSTEFTYEGNDFYHCQNELDSVSSAYKAGGLRIKKIKFTSPVGESGSFEKNYEYTYAGKSSGVLESPFANQSTMFHWGAGRLIYNPYCGTSSWPQVCSFYTVHHDNTVPLGNAQGGAIGYAQVIEKNSDGSKKVMQFTNGGFDYATYDPLFDGWADGYNDNYLGDKLIQDRLCYDYSSYRGKLKNVAYYNSAGQKIKQEVHKFTNLVDDRVTFMDQQRSQSFFATINESFLGAGICDLEPDYSTGWYSYNYFQRNVVPTVDSLYTFVGDDIVKEVTKYEYNSPYHPDPSRIVKVGQAGDSTITVFRYPYDFTFPPTVTITNPTSQGVGLLQEKNVFSQPVETYVIKKDAGGGNARTTDAQFVTYKTTSPVPESVYRISNSAGLTDFSPASLTVSSASTDSRYVAGLKFHTYDSFANVLEQGKDLQAKEVLVWGYHRRFVVARVSNSDYATVIALVDTNVVKNPSSDAALRTELAKIRTGLASSNPQAKVTTYTYATLKGITSITDPRGDTTYYEYDSYGRLKRGKDPDDQVKENLWYHYQP